MKQSLLLFFLVFLVLPVFSQKQAFTLDDLYKIKSVRDPQFSPDGRQIAFTVTQYFLADGKSNTDIYVMNADGSNQRQMTNNPASDSHPRWSSDGKFLLFVSTRSDGEQAWKLPVNGGEATQLTHLSTGVNQPVWASGDEKIFFYTRVFPECGADDACNKALNDDLENGTMQAHLADHLLYRHWTFWKDGSRLHTFVYDPAAGSYQDLTPGDMDYPSFTAGGDGGFDISPDGKELCVAANPDSNEAETTNKDLWIIPTTGGEAQNLTKENHAYDANPQYSPDGRYIAFIMQKIPGYESDLLRLAIYDRQSRQKTVLTDDFDNWVDDFQWAPDSRSIYFKADVKGHRPLYNVDIRTKKIRQVVDMKTIDDFDISPDGKTVAISRRAVGEPAEIWRVSVNGEKLQRLTMFNKEIEKTVDIRPAEEMWIASPTGKKIHTFIVKPHNFDASKKYPLILNVHGGPQSQWTDGFRGDWQVYPGAGYIVAFANPHGSSGYGQEFTHEISGDWGGKVYQDVMAVADSLSRLSWVDEDRMGAMGLVLRRLHDDVAGRSHHPFQSHCRHDGFV